jgi:hypothetical protein
MVIASLLSILVTVQYSEYLDAWFLRYSTVETGDLSPWWWRQYRLLKGWWNYTGLHLTTTQKTAIFSGSNYLNSWVY